jgi:hypothetical protein
MRTHLLRSRGLFLSANGQVQTPFPLPGNGA